MNGVSVPAWQREHRYVGLADIVRSLGALGVDLVWRLNVVDAGLSPGADRLESIPWSRAFTTDELVQVFTPDTQLVDGEVQGFQAETDTQPDVIIRAVDSTSWDVESQVQAVLDAIRGHYPESTPLR